MELTDIDARAVATALAGLNARFHTREVSEHRAMLAAHNDATDGNYHAMVGSYLSQNRTHLGLCLLPEYESSRGACWSPIAALREPRRRAPVRRAFLMLLQLTDMRHSLRDKTLRRGVRLLLPLAAAATSSGAWVACDWNVDFLSAGNGTEDAGNEPDATIRPEADSGADAGSDAGLAATDADADGAAEDGAQDATLDARPDSGMADAPPGDAACDPMAPEGGTNYVVNPGFEDPTDPGTGWFANYGGTFSVSSTQGHCGYHSGEISGRSVYYNGLGTNLPPTPGTYAITMWLLQDGTTPYQIAPSGAAVCGDAGTTSFLNIGYVTVPPNVWTYLSGTLTVPSGCTSLILAIGGNYLAPGTPNLFADDVYAVR